MKASTCILVLFVLVAACSRHPEPAPSTDEGMQKKLAGVWIHERRSPFGQDIVATLEISPGGTYSAVTSFPKRKRGRPTLEDGGTWHIEAGFLIITSTTGSETNAPVPIVVRYRIVRLNDRELELEPPDTIDGVSILTNTVVYRKHTR